MSVVEILEKENIDIIYFCLILALCIKEKCFTN